MSRVGRLPLPQNRAFWILLALVIKGAFFAWYLSRTYYHDITGFWGQSNGDMMTYINPVEGLLAGQGFQTDDRMPGYPGLYLAFRLVLPAAMACNALILLQLLVSAVSVYVLGLVARQLFGQERAFYWAYFIYVFSTFVSVFDGYFLTESLAASATIFFLYAWLRFEAQPARWVALVVAGGWLAWSVFLKPAHLPLLGVPVAIWAVQCWQGRLAVGRVVRYSALFLLPFLLADGAWTLRNYRRYHEVIPLLKNAWYPESYWPANYFDLMAFCQTYGEDYAYWFPNTGIRWLQGWGNGNFLPPVRWYVKEELAPPPNYVYTSVFSPDSIAQVRTLCYELGNAPGLTPTRITAIRAELKDRLTRYTKSVRAEKPHIYYGWALIRYTSTFLHGTWGYNFLEDILRTGWVRFLLRLYHYCFVLVPGLIGLVLLTRRGIRSDSRLLALPLFMAYCVGVYVVVLRHPETRYLVPFYPILVLSAVSSFLTLTHFTPYKPDSYGIPFRHSADL